MVYVFVYRLLCRPLHALFSLRLDAMIWFLCSLDSFWFCKKYFICLVEMNEKIVQKKYNDHNNGFTAAQIHYTTMWIACVYSEAKCFHLWIKRRAQTLADCLTETNKTNIRKPKILNDCQINVDFMLMATSPLNQFAYIRMRNAFAIQNGQ